MRQLASAADQPGTWAAAFQLTGWLLAGLLLSVAAVARRRRLDM